MQRSLAHRLPIGQSHAPSSELARIEKIDRAGTPAIRTVPMWSMVDACSRKVWGNLQAFLTTAYMMFGAWSFELIKVFNRRMSRPASTPVLVLRDCAFLISVNVGFDLLREPSNNTPSYSHTKRSLLYRGKL